MTHNFTRPKYLLRWDHSCAKNFDRDVVVTPHRLSELSLSQDQQLVDLLDRHPQEDMQVFSMGQDLAYPSELQIGELVGCSGEQLLRSVRSGRLIIVLANVAKHYDTFGGIVARLYSELAECATGFRPANLSGELVIASPGAMQYFNCDSRPTIRWQLRGSQSISVYPTTDPFVDPLCFQNTILDSNAAPPYYEPEFARDAETYLVEAGQMISLPFLTPRHIDCHANLCVWIQTEHDTPASLRQKSIAATNRLLGHFLPRAGQNNSTRGQIATAKQLFGDLFGLAQRVAHSKCDPEPTFRITRSNTRRRGTVCTPSAALKNQLPLAGFLPGANPTITKPVVSEN